MYFINVEQVIRLNKKLVTESNEHFAVLFRGTLEGCVERLQRILFGVEIYQGIYEKAAALMLCIAAKSPFENGNKRTAIAATLTFLQMNGITVNVGIRESIQFTLMIAKSQTELTEVISWLRAHVAEPSI